jgi:hypothetical protein
LDFADWLVYADFVAESERRNNTKKKAKDEAYARAIGKALRKMYVAGVNPKCAMVGRIINENYAGWWMIEKWSEIDTMPPALSICKGVGLERTFFTHRPVRWAMPNEVRWLRKNTTIYDPPLYGPADIREPHLHLRLLRKYWRTVLIRATGIPDSVLG